MAAIWTCAQTYPTEEANALRHLQNQKYEAFFPYFFFKPKRGASRAKPLFPGYVFVRVRDDQLWMPIQNTHSVKHLLTRFEDITVGIRPGNLSPEQRYKTPWIVPENFIASMARCVVSADKALGSALNAGMRARVKEGPDAKKGIFAGHEAVVRWRDGVRLALLFSLMGREVEVEFHVSEVEPV